jgi:hypothetical protein
MINDEKPKNTTGSRKQWVWIMLMVNIVFMLLLITLGIIALRVGNSLPEGTDILFIVGKNPSVTVGDSENGGGVWEAGKNVNLFKAEYKNGKGQTTVVSQDGTKLIAPGTKTTYTFTMQNNGNMAVVYETDIDFVLKVGDEKVDASNFPLKVRLVNDRDEYIIGEEDKWVQVHQATIAQHPGLLGANSYENFTLQLYWEFEGGNDELDTLLGDLSSEKGVTLTLKIKTYAEEALDPTAQGGNKIEVEGTEEHGGTVRWLWLVLLMTNSAILVFYVSWLMNKRVNNM